MGEESWGKDRALKLICGWGLESLGIDTVELMTLPGNVASERVV